MNKLEIKNLYVDVEGKEILKGINLEIKIGEVHALMGPNGSGKSTLANVLMGNPKYKIKKGKIILDGKNITNLAVNERAKLGMFMSFQYPKEVTGVTLTNFLRTAYNSVKEKKLDVLSFYKLLKEKMIILNIDESFNKRNLNEGFSGGEKKKVEILQMSVLNPKYMILDECDSGLDINSIKIIGEGIDNMKRKDNGILIITHYYRILNYVKPNRVSIMINGKIVKSGGKELAEGVEKGGFDAFLDKIERGRKNGV